MAETCPIVPESWVYPLANLSSSRQKTHQVSVCALNQPQSAAQCSMTSSQLTKTLTNSIEDLIAKIQRLAENVTNEESLKSDVEHTSPQRKENYSQQSSNRNIQTQNSPCLKKVSYSIRRDSANKIESVQIQSEVALLSDFYEFQKAPQMIKLDVFCEPSRKLASSRQINPELVPVEPVLSSPSRVRPNLKSNETSSRQFGVSLNDSNTPQKELGLLFNCKKVKQLASSVIFDSPSVSEKKQSLTIDDFEIGECIGNGKFGDVYVSRHRETGWIFALKKIFKSTIEEYAMQEQLTREIKIQMSLDHPNIVKMYGFFSDEYHVFLLMEFVPGQTAISKLKCSQPEAASIVKQVLSGCEFLHNHRIVHRDIKPENLVLGFKDVVKICDFGWSATMTTGHMKTTFCGTLDYLSPEMKQIGSYCAQVDLWSIGVLTYELLVGKAPFHEDLTRWQRQGMPSQSQHSYWIVSYPFELSYQAQDFMRGLLKTDPKERSTAKMSLLHRFISFAQQNECLDSQVWFDMRRLLQS